MQRGAKQKTESPIKYWTFSKGQFTRRVSENTKGAVSRTLGDKSPTPGKVIYEVFTDEATGQLVDIRLKNGNYGKSYQLIMDITEDEHSPEFMAIEFNYDGAGKSLLKKLPNIDLSADVALVCYSIDDTNQKGEPIKRYYAVPYQGEISKAGKVQPAYTKENRNGFPELAKVKIKGKQQWDDSDQLDFLENLIINTAFPGMPGEEKAPKAAAPKDEEINEDFLEPSEDEVGF